MAPVRRYLRISKYSVLECRIYLDNPSLAQSWLLNPRNPILPQVIESIRPLVLPKLREEKERSKKKSTKKKHIKDVIVHDDFEVSMFLTETSTRHSLLTKHKHFREKGPGMMQSNSNKLISESNETPFDVEDDAVAPVRVEEESEDEGVRLADIPIARPSRRSKRQRDKALADEESEMSNEDDTTSAIDLDSDAEQPPFKRLRGAGLDADDEDDDKKKMAMDVSYEGFAIYGRVLCLVVKKRENKAAQAAPAGQAVMENWITSTQMAVGEEAP